MPTKRRPWKFSDIQLVHTALSALYPNIFDLENPVPLKVGIRRDIRAQFPAMNSTVMSHFLGYITTRPKYLDKCVEGAPRYDLDGQCGFVTAEEAAYAVKRRAQQLRKQQRELGRAA